MLCSLLISYDSMAIKQSDLVGLFIYVNTSYPPVNAFITSILLQPYISSRMMFYCLDISILIVDLCVFCSCIIFVLCFYAVENKIQSKRISVRAKS